MPNVSVQVRRLVRRNLQRLVRNFILAVRLFHSHSQIMACASPLHLCLASSRSVHFQCERRRSPSAHLVRRKGGTHCSDLYYGCSAVPFPAPNRLFLRRIRPHQRPGGSSYFLSERSIGRCCHLPGKSRLSGHKGRGRGRNWQVDKICLRYDRDPRANDAIDLA